MNNDNNKILDNAEQLENNIDHEKNNMNYDEILEKLQKDSQIEIQKLNHIIQDQDRNIIYLKSDIENIKRNSLKEIQSSISKQISKIIDLFLSVFDDYERTIDYAKKHKNTDIIDGLSITYNSFLKALKELDVVEIDTNNMFDPSLHEAISTIFDPSKISNSIAEVVQKGFMYKKQVLRPAKVIIYS